MKLIIKDRAAGKTTMLIHTSEATGYPIVVSTRRQVDLLKEAAKRLGANIPEPISITDLKQRGIQRPENVLIDNIEFILSNVMDEYLGCHVVAATLSNENRQ